MALPSFIFPHNPRQLFSPSEDFAVSTNILNNMWLIIGQSGQISANQHRDLENLMSLARFQGDYL